VTSTVRPGRPIPNIFRTIAHHPVMLKDWWVFGTAVLQKGSLSPRHREMLLLRTGWRCGAEYEWGQHTRVARSVGVTDEEIARIIEGPDAPGWSPLEAALMRAADELHDDSCISDATWATLAAEYTTQQLIEVPMVVGQYTLVSMTLNSLGVELDDWIEGFPG
jgi:alkylhydroperoxidase family enzyme